MKAIDTCSFVFPTKEILRYMIYSWGIYEGYLNMFARNIFSIMGMSKEKYEEMVKSLSKQQLLDKLADLFSKFEVPMSDFVEMLDESGIEKAVHINEDVEATTGVKPVSNEYISKLISEYPDKLLAFAGVDPNKGKAAVDEAEKALTKLELSGLTLYPFKHKIPPEDPKYYPLYEVAIRYNAPIWFHASVNWDNRTTMYLEHPQHFDKLASIYPDLKIIIGHAGWPWVNEFVASTWRHKNMYIEISAFRPKYIGQQGSGFETLMYYGDRVIRDKVVWGSTWILLGMQHNQILEEMKQLPVREESLKRWLYDNAKKLLNL